MNYGLFILVALHLLSCKVKVALGPLLRWEVKTAVLYPDLKCFLLATCVHL